MRVRAFIVLAIAAVLFGASSSVSAAGANGLRAPHASPTSGTTATAFSFRVTYAGRFAAFSVNLDIAGRSIPMLLASGTATDGTWNATTTLPEGTWSPIFQVFAVPGDDPSISGPTVTVTQATLPSSMPTPAVTIGPITPPRPDADGGDGDGSTSSPPPAAPAATGQPAATGGGASEPTGAPAPASSPTRAAAPVQAPGGGVAVDPTLSDGATVGTSSQASEPEGGNGGESSVSSSASPARAPSAASARSAPRQPDGSPTGGATAIPDDGAFGLLELTLGIGGMAALALSTLFMLLAGRRRRTAPGRSAIGDEVRVRVSTAEEQVTAALHQRTLRRSKIRLDEDPIVASMGLATPDDEPARPARRVTRRSPPT